MDNIVGTSGNDTIIAGTQNTNPTLNAGDQINGGAGTDSLNIFAGTANLGAVTLSGVEIINNSEDASFDVSGLADVTQAWSIGGAAKTVTATVAQTVGFANATTGGASTALFNNVAGLADAATIAVKDAGKTTTYTSITVDGIETLTVSATGKNQLGNLSGDAVSTLKVTGDGTVSAIAIGGGSFKTVDASANTGGVTLDISGAAAADLKVTGGSGKDEITVDYANLTKADVIDLGAGADTLGFAVTNVDFTDATKAGALAGVSNVEALKSNGALTFDADASLIAQTGFVQNSTGTMVLTKLGNTDSVTIGGLAGGATTLGLELGQSIANVTMAGGAAAASTNTMTITGSATVNVASTGTAGVANNNLALTAADNQAVVVTGSQNLTLTTTAGTGTTGFAIDGSAFTGKLTVTGTAASDNVKGGTGADTISGGAGAVINPALKFTDHKPYQLARWAAPKGRYLRAGLIVTR